MTEIIPSYSPYFKLYVRCYTYNHASYIVDAMNGFTMQRTDFPFVCIIVDDASSDGEPDVIKQYLSDNFNTEHDSIVQNRETDDYVLTFARHKSNHNCFFAVYLLKYNHYKKKAKRPYFQEWTESVKYVALCEGDDYWTSPLKLQKQVDYLESHPECKMCCHAIKWETNGVMYDGGCQHNQPCNLSADEVIRNNGLYIATCSLVYSGELDLDRPEWRKVANVGDFPLQILGSLRGDLFFSPEIMGVYRYMSKGSWTGQHFGSKNKVAIEYSKNKILWMSMLDKETNGKYSSAINALLYHYYLSLYHADEISFSEYFRATIRTDEKHIRRLSKDFLIHYFKPFYKVWLFLTGKQRRLTNRNN